MIEAANLIQTYPDGTKGIDGISLSIKPGEFVAIVGSSGAGKSTFLRLLNGVLSSVGGSLNVLNTQVVNANSKTLKRLRSQIGFIYQQFNLVKRLSVLENVLVGRLGFHGTWSGTLGLFNDYDKNLALKTLKKVGLEAKVGSRADRLSGGEQQRVAIARALVQEPKLILADEPMASLDPQLSDVVLGLLKNVNQKNGITVVVNIHNPDLARKYATRIIGLKKGKIIFDGVPSQFTSHVAEAVYEKL